MEIDGDLEIWDLPSSVSAFRLLLHSRRQLAERQEAAGGRFHFIRHRPLQDDLGPRVVGDFHQAGGQGELVAKRDERFGIRRLEIWRFRILNPDP